MKIKQETLTKIQSIATILSLIAIPLVLAIAGWFVQSSISNEGIKKDYVQIAIGILKDSDKMKDEELRKWAVGVLDKNSPVPFTSSLKDKLEKGTASVHSMVVPPPAPFMQPPLKLEKLPGKGPVSVRDLMLSVSENYARCRENALTLEYLQEWARIITVPGYKPPLAEENNKP